MTDEKRKSSTQHPGYGEKNNLRLFVAVPLWDSFRKNAGYRLEDLRRFDWPVKWVRPENWHITLKFLGNVPAKAPKRLETALKEQLAPLKPFNLVIGGLGGFPRLSRMRVLWVGVQEGEENLVLLARAVHLGCVVAGFPGDKKPFQPHLTLARSRGEPVSVRVPHEIYSDPWGELHVDSVSIVKSTLTPQGSIYETLLRVPLSGTGES